MKIAIVGAGISGLTTYLWMKKMLPYFELHQVTIYESDRAVKPSRRSDPNQAPETVHSASSFIISPNGLRVLERLDDSLLHDVTRAGAPLANYVFKSTRGFTLMKQPAGDLREPRMTCVMIACQDLWTCLRQRVPNNAIKVARVSEVIPGTRNIIRFSDNNNGYDSVEADLVIGADGPNSIVRKTVLGEQRYKEFALEYQGTVSVSGFMAAKFLPEESKTNGAMNLVCGGNGSFGYGTASSSLAEPTCYLPSQALPAGDRAWWSSSFSIEENSVEDGIGTEDIRCQLKKRFGKWKDNTVRYCVENATIEGMYPAVTLPLLPTWDQNRILLIGDAAHVVLPSSGQGACQALEDAEALVRLLTYYLSKAYGLIPDDGDRYIRESQAVAVAAKKFFKMRAPRIHKIIKTSRMLDLNKPRGVFKEWALYMMLWALGTHSVSSSKPAKLLLKNKSGTFGKYVAQWSAKENFQRELMQYDLPAHVEDMLAEGILEADFDDTLFEDLGLDSE